MVASPQGDVLWIKAPTLNAPTATAYAIVAASVKLHGRAVVATVSGSGIYVSLKAGRTIEDTRRPNDATWAASELAPLIVYMIPGLCLLLLPRFLLSVWRRSPFTEGDIRYGLQPKDGVLAEHLYINRLKEPRKWRLTVHDRHLLQEVLEVLLTDFKTGVKEALGVQQPPTAATKTPA